MSDDLDELFDATGDANDFDPHFEASLRHRVEMRDEIIEALTAERDQLYERWNDCQEKRMAAVARAEAAEAELKAMTAERDQLYEGWNACRSLALETIARAEAAEAERDALTAENNRLREELTKAADSLGWADAHLEDAGVISAQVRYGEKQARAALKGEQK